MERHRGSIGRTAIVIVMTSALFTATACASPPTDAKDAAADTLSAKQIESPSIDEFVRLQQIDPPYVSIGESFRKAQAVVIGKVEAIDDPRWNSRDGSDWRDDFAKQVDAFTIPMAYTTVHVRVSEVVATGKDPSVSKGDSLEIDFVLDPSLDVLTAEEQAERDSPGVLARYLSSGDERVFVLNWYPFPYADGWGEERWRVDVSNGLWGFDQAKGVGYPAGSGQAKELSELALPSLNIVDEMTAEIALEDFYQLVADARQLK